MTPQQQMDFFDEQGYLIIETLLTPASLERCNAEIDRLHEFAAELEAKGDRTTMSFQREPYLDGEDAKGPPILRKIESAGDHSQTFRDLATHPQLIEVLANLLGPDLLLYRNTLMLKPAHHGSVHALHQDTAYWPMEPANLITVSIALNDATPENGCFKVIPGSHRWPQRQWGAIARKQGESLTDQDDLDTSGQIDVPLNAGSALLFHSAIIHGSDANRSPRSRHTALYAYFTPDVVYKPGDHDPRERTFRVVAGHGGIKTQTFVAETAGKST